MRINRQIGVLSLLVMLLAGCSNPAPAPAAAAPPEPAQTPESKESPRPEAPAVAPRPAPAAKAKKAPQVTPPVASAPAEAPRQTAVYVPPAPDTPSFPTPSPAPAPVAPPEPTTRRVTLPSGTMVSVLMSDPVDSETARVGQTFRATLDTPLTADRETVASRGADVYLRLTHVESAGNLTGRSEVALELDRIVIGGKSYTVASNTYEKQAASQTVETAKHTGIGAAIGGVVGAIAGGKKGAAIGAGVGGGTGVAIEAATKGKQVRIDSESRVDFHLQQPLEVTVDARPNSSPTQRDSSSGPRLLNGRVPSPSAVEGGDDSNRLNLSGKWRISMDSPEGSRNLDMTLREAGDRLEGTLFDRGRGQALRGSIRGDSISFSTDSGFRFEGRVAGDRLRGTVTSQGESGRNGRSSNQSFNWTADRND